MTERLVCRVGGLLRNSGPTSRRTQSFVNTLQRMLAEARRSLPGNVPARCLATHLTPCARQNFPESRFPPATKAARRPLAYFLAVSRTVVNRQLAVDCV